MDNEFYTLPSSLLGGRLTSVPLTAYPLKANKIRAIVLGSTESSVGPISNWILTTGSWDDTGLWEDTENWNG